MDLMVVEVSDVELEGNKGAVRNGLDKESNRSKFQSENCFS